MPRAKVQKNVTPVTVEKVGTTGDTITRTVSATDTAVAAVLALITPDASADAVTTGVATIVRPLNAATRKAVLVGLSSRVADLGTHVATVLPLITSAPAGRDPEVLVAEHVAAVLAYAAATVNAATGWGPWPAMPPAPSAEVAARAAEKVAAIRDGNGRQRTEVGRTVAALHAAGVRTVTIARTGKPTLRGTVSADGITVGRTLHASASAAARAAMGVASVNGWVTWRAEDGRTIADVIDGNGRTA